ncbi:MAG: ornithine--oxo-acid transaminase [Elusimicrobia bacterium]|nr:ornithine--oxo-acid transaminase [Elusimicrobiota bacterium]
MPIKTKEQKTDSEKFIADAETYSARNYHPLPVVLSRAEGVWIYDPEGKKYLDMLSSYSALNQGHRHPKIIAALLQQAQRLTLTSRAFHNETFGPFCKELAQLCGMEKVLLMNTGAEAVETALKTARKWAYQAKGVPQDQAEIIVCANNFHGRTIAIVGFSTEELYRKDFGPFAPGFKIIPFGDLSALERAITPRTAAYLVEPIQCEAGILIPPEGTLRKARKLCQEARVLFMLDEIQTGLGRTGRMFAFEHEGARPDVLILGKALGGGVLPISAVVSSEKILGLFEPGEHGSTFGGNPLACAVGRAALSVLREEKLPEKAQKLGAYFLERLKTLRHPQIREVRGKGLILGIELDPAAAGARAFCEKLMERGVLCKETHEHVIRFAPPLVITPGELDWAFEQIQKVFA